jgi:methionine-S-sulfoxide reductase
MPHMCVRAAALLAALVVIATLSVQPAHTGESAATPVVELATFAAGCFWCTEADFDKVAGVVETTSGYMGGKTPNPTYKQVSAGGTGHAEVVQLRYDPSKVTYKQLLDVYWRNVDPLDKDGQFCDRGEQYRPAIFYHNEEQRRLAEESKSVLQKSGRFKQPIAVEITAASIFTRAEDYHQDFHLKQPIRYAIYRHGCARDARLEALWGPAKSH